MSRFVHFATSYCVPWGFRSEISTDQERDRPDPLDRKGKSPADVSFKTGHGSHNTRREENTSTPTHTHIGCHVRSEDCRNDLTGVASGECLKKNKRRLLDPLTDHSMSTTKRKHARTWNTPQETPHIASPNARTGREGANTGIKIITVIQAMKNIIVGRHPKRSCAYMLMMRPNSWPTTEELERPDCQEAGIEYFCVAESYTPNRSWNWVWP